MHSVSHFPHVLWLKHLYLQSHPQKQDLNCPGCGSHFVRLSGFVKHIELDECPSMDLKNIEERMQQRVRMTKALSNIDKMSKGDVYTQQEKSFYDYLGHDIAPARPWYLTDTNKSPWSVPVEDTWASDDPVSSMNKEPAKMARHDYVPEAPKAPDALAGDGNSWPKGSGDENAWAKKKNLFPNAPDAIKPTVGQLQRLQDDQRDTEEREREKRLCMAEPNSPMFKAEEFWNEFSRKYKCPHKYCM